MATADRMILVTGQVHAEAVTEQLPDLPQANLITEPSPRESMAAIGLAAAIIARRDPEAIMGSFAADHKIDDPETFREVIAQAVAAAKAGELVTIGIEPTWAATGFGYIESGEPLDIDGAPDVVRVKNFVEKPDGATAQTYLDSGNYRWNAGMFVTRVDHLLGLLKEHHPKLHAGVSKIAEAWGTDKQQGILDAKWPGLTRIAIDHAIAEPVAARGGVASVPGNFKWDDVGDWKSLAGLLPGPEAREGVQVLGEAERVISKDASGLVVPSGRRMVAVLGLDDVVVVDTYDAVLVASRERAQDVKGLVNALKERGRDDIT